MLRVYSLPLYKSGVYMDWGARLAAVRITYVLGYVETVRIAKNHTNREEYRNRQSTY